jgi:hypothetical protein
LKKLLPFFVWLVALGTLVGAAQTLRQQRDTSDTSAALAAVPQFTVKAEALGLKDYQTIQKKVAVFGTVGLVAGSTALTVKAEALSDYAAWRLTIDQVLLDNPGIRWNIESVCSGKCAGGEALKAVLTGARPLGAVNTTTKPDTLTTPSIARKVSSSG